MIIMVTVALTVRTGLQHIVMMIGHSTATALMEPLIHPLEKSRTLAVTHVAIVKVSNVFHDRKTTTYYNIKNDVYGSCCITLEYFQLSNPEPLFYLANMGSECPVSKIVSELEECKVAATQLGGTYKGSFTNNERPAGCYYWSTYNNVYFNFANQSDTQNIHTNSGAVCRKGTSNILLYVLYRHVVN